MAPRILIVTALAAAAVALVPASALAGVQPAGTGEPAYTRSAQNTQWVEWGATSGADEYRLRHDYYANNTLTANPTTSASPSGGTSWMNWSGVATLQHGGQYGICVQGSYSFPNDSLFFSDGPNSCSMGTQLGRRTHTTIDRSKPSASMTVAGGAAAVRDTLIPVQMNYQDDVSPPFPANFLCVAPGADATAACGTAIFGYTPACSSPASGGLTTTFNCQMETSGINPPDGPLWVCAIAADSAIPDNPSSSNQTGTADQANLSDKVCDSVLMDRTAPTVAINTPSTTVSVGQAVSFAAQASDATSGLSSAPAEWSFGDGGAGASGDSASRTFTQAGTYTVQLRMTDAAGNQGTASRSITVVSPAQGGSGGQATPGSGGQATPPAGKGPSAADIAAAAGGGAVQSGRVRDLTVTAPKRVRLNGRRSFLIGVNAARAGLLQVRVTKGRRVRARATAVLAAGAKAQRVKLPKGMKPGRHTLKIAFTPAGSARAASTSLRITFTKAGRRSRAAAVASSAPLPSRELVSPAGLPAPMLPDGKLHGAPAGRVFEVR